MSKVVEHLTNNKMIDESQLPFIPRYVAEYIESNRDKLEGFQDPIVRASNWYAQTSAEPQNAVYRWLLAGNFEKYATAWVVGYFVDKEENS
ncbi:DUF1642 domain-containing protein [Lactiplantibacillus plantarum]|uniref:DUF1642 domain-containing protein n=1 Tax=Lactiplantibacillus plantarum TaxID=1590 RepID=UPI001AAFCB03|nr:DUF1642 domain-containing protein [Lactiplantibacillus plantarum]MBO2705226.1 DUF1642 domain-containing protein [Lactiplantibacillus plantarum]MDN7037925.1 DUF1642 domain-containing protein [Lactiplantibacillus plantarum]MDO7795355.1 DUF1642 domain-containing protein [Lactiplantibacillus plantarum]WVI00458.1 DUF1642 domain-containing protein [Lactiplantibacillus plantarum]